MDDARRPRVATVVRCGAMYFIPLPADADISITDYAGRLGVSDVALSMSEHDLWLIDTSDDPHADERRALLLGCATQTALDLQRDGHFPHTPISYRTATVDLEPDGEGAD